MPELPEVEFCRRALDRWVRAPIRAVEVLDPRVIRGATTARPTAGLDDGAARLTRLIDRPPAPPERHGKRILWRFGEDALVLHLGMTGKWTRRPTPHAKVILHLDDGPLTYADPRLLGGIVPLPLAAARAALTAGLGPDALRDGLPRLTGRRPIKVALMDQAAVAGLGNLHAAEALWRACVDPRAPTDTLDDDAWARLRVGVAEQLRFALQTLGEDEEILYVEDPGGPNPFPLYQRAGEPCPRCGAPIGRLVQAGRSTWWCPACQAVSRP